MHVCRKFLATRDKIVKDPDNGFNLVFRAITFVISLNYYLVQYLANVIACTCRNKWSYRPFTRKRRTVSRAITEPTFSGNVTCEQSYAHIRTRAHLIIHS